MTTISDRPVGVTRITLLEADGSETVLNVTDNLHFLLGFATCGPDGGKNIPVELIVKGDSEILGELYFQAGERHPELLEHCAKRLTEKTRARLKARGIDPVEEAFKIVPVVGGTQ